MFVYILSFVVYGGMSESCKYVAWTGVNVYNTSPSLSQHSSMNNIGLRC